MGVKRKITVKTGLNYDVKGRYSEIETLPTHPVYVEITYNRKYTKFPYKDYWFTQHDFSLNHILEKASRETEEVLEHEIKRNPNFTVKGFSNRLKTWLSPLHLAGYLSIIDSLQDEIKQKMPAAKYENWQAKSMYDRVAEGLEWVEITDSLKAMIGAAELLRLGPFIHYRSVYWWLIESEFSKKEERVSEVLGW
ncbi:MAG: hypothetical protein AAFO91_09960, partial [Bacteroidota bacterium]